MDACHRYGQKQEGACQLHDPHKTEQEILAGNERGRDGCWVLLSPLKTVPLTYPAESEAAGGRKTARKESKGVKFIGTHSTCLVKSAAQFVYPCCARQ